MSLVIPNVGEIELLNKMIRVALMTDESYVLKLYRMDITLSATTVAADLNGVEANFSSYTAQTLTRAGWNGVILVGSKAQTTYSSAQSWTCGVSGNIIYGYYVLGATSGVLLWVERFANSRILNNGDILNLTPVFSLAQC